MDCSKKAVCGASPAGRQAVEEITQTSAPTLRAWSSGPCVVIGADAFATSPALREKGGDAPPSLFT
jgi:hypothetical protein